MAFILESFQSAFVLILRLDRELLNIMVLSLKVSGSALISATIIGLPVAALLGLTHAPLKGFFLNLMNTCMGLPPVVVGLFIYLILSRSGPLGFMGLLYTPTAMMTAQFVLALPIIVALCHSAIVSVDPVIRQAAITLGATGSQASLTVIAEARYGIISAIIAGFGRLMAEVGAILIVGGNIAGHTRVMTTTIALEADKGNFELALALGIILLGMALFVNSLLLIFQRKGIVRK
ncbi:MAG: ABC transporter permease [Desulfobacterales bacterium]|nr:ABC transporter permease [Desulfobacterales bacterium]